MPENVSSFEIHPLNLVEPYFCSFERGVPEEVGHGEPDPRDKSTT